MYRGAMLLAATLLLTTAAPTRVGAQGVDGTWKLSHVVGGAFETTTAIVKLTADNSKVSGELIAGAPRKLTSVEQPAGVLRMAIQNGAIESVFEASIPKEATKRITGTLIIDGTATPAWLTATEETKLPKFAAARPLVCPPMQQARIEANKAASLRFRASKLKDPEEKQQLLKEADEAAEAAKTEVPKLYKQVLAECSDSPAVFEASLELIRKAQASGVKAQEVRGWAKTGAEAAKAYGPSWQAEFTTQVAAALAGQDKLTVLALDYARQAEKLLTPKSPATEQVRVLSLLSRALLKSGKAEEAKSLEVRVAKLDEILDGEYVKKIPFKGEAFPGRTGKSDRTVFMELFTGAMCPPCVAADLAFDVLQKTYKPSELVLIQYHMHIPLPDPLTNPDTEARWKYYGKQVTGVPASMFNGQPKIRGGGLRADAEKKYGQYRSVIDELLEEDAKVRLTVKAARKGDIIEIDARVAHLMEPDASKKLRILLAEETVRYLGSNKIRLHHNVVRAFPGGVAGKSLTSSTAKVETSINLANLRGQLTKYLDDFQANSGRAFSNPARPLAMEHLRVIAFVQDDSTQEILQVAQVEVK